MSDEWRWLAGGWILRTPKNAGCKGHLSQGARVWQRILRTPLLQGAKEWQRQGAGWSGGSRDVTPRRSWHRESAVIWQPHTPHQIRAALTLSLVLMPKFPCSIIKHCVQQLQEKASRLFCILTIPTKPLAKTLALKRKIISTSTHLISYFSNGSMGLFPKCLQITCKGYV